jgi:hypothetical protein
MAMSPVVNAKKLGTTEVEVVDKDGKFKYVKSTSNILI